MTKDQAVSTIVTETPKTAAELMAAIKSLGKTQKEIKANLIKLGFKNYDQGSSRECPVCQYLKKIGLESPYVDCEGLGSYESEGRIDITYIGNAPMARFQRKAANCKIKGLGGYRKEGL